MSRVDVGGVGTEYEVFGAGRPVVLLHGFPDTGRLWRHQAPVLAEAGFQVIVPDLRGYGRSDKPEAVDAYSMRVLAGDVMAILAALGEERPMVATTVHRPLRATPAELAKVDVKIVDAHNFWLKCTACGRSWSPNLRARGRLPRGYWQCPEGCNAP